MRRSHVWLTVLSFLALVFRLTVSQPYTELAQLPRLQRHLIALYEQYRQNPAAVDLERFMDSQLIARTRGVINLIRGWAIDASEEANNAEASMNYIRSFVLYVCIIYADSLYDAYSIFNLNADVLLQATEIFRIRSNYEWVLQPCDSIVRFELMQFHRFDIRARAANGAPYVQVYSRNTTSARFLHEITISSSISFTNSINMCSGLSPVRRNPQSNLLHEVRMLRQAQQVVLAMGQLSEANFQSHLYNELFYLNAEVACVIHETLETYLRQNNYTEIYRVRFHLKKIRNLVVLQRFMQFVLAEFGRHVHHPAHIKYGHIVDANVTAALNVNHKLLMNAYDDLVTSLNDLINNRHYRAAFRELIYDLPLRIGYVCYGKDLALRVGLAWQSQIDE